MFIEDLIAKDARYPGENDQSLAAEWLRSPPARLSVSDLQEFWLIDYRNPNGFTPLGMTHLELAYCWGSQAAAASTPLPFSDGYKVRLIGPYCYSSDQPVASLTERQSRLESFRSVVARLPQTFAAEWVKEKAEISKRNMYFQSLSLAAHGREELVTAIAEARAHLKWVWERHFAILYPLLALQSSFYQLADEIGIEKQEVAELLKGEPSIVTEADDGLILLAMEARLFGVEKVLREAAANPSTAIQHLMAHGGEAARWINALQSHISRHGWRADEVGNPAHPSSLEKSELVLQQVLGILDQTSIQTRANALATAQTTRAQIESAIRDRLSTPECNVFDLAIHDLRQANFAWWNEDHNPLIDMAAMLPLRKVALEIARRSDLSSDEIVFAFCNELPDLARTKTAPANIRSLIKERRDYYNHWQGLRQQLPRHFGPVPDQIDDPVYVEIEGLTPQYLESIKATGDLNKLYGTAACGGSAEGLARVILDVAELHTIKSGEVLVCEGSTPSWTPVFGRIAACLVDQGGTLSHTAIIAREVGTPCVVGLGRATQVIKTGDRVRVNADRGIVEVVAHG
jgi:phosphohistidine swiveling domain-containing protein